LVHLKNTDTAEGKVDLLKVQEVIRALRRRYSSRSNIQHIFKDWDAAGKGYIEAGDIQSMLGKMGLKLNLDEAQMILTCIDENGDQRVRLNEFLDLVFTHNDAITSLDISHTDAVRDSTDMTFVDEIKRNVERTRHQRPLNQWKFFLQKNLNNIALDLLTVDAERTYDVDLKDFMRVIERRSKIPEYLVRENEGLLH